MNWIQNGEKEGIHNKQSNKYSAKELNDYFNTKISMRESMEPKSKKLNSSMSKRTGQKNKVKVVNQINKIKTNPDTISNQQKNTSRRITNKE